ncbi:hypothetical protein HanOQP8_Chr05g0182061 [Helianthus annuus]|nr:hypothetical protein HanOQP8_Chr05g0182061 [Helianthus annuus]
MNVLGEYPDAINKKDLQIWNNSAFDDGGDSESFKSPSWVMKKPVVVSSDSSFSSKENQSPIGFNPKSSLLVHESKPFKNLNKIGSLKPVEKTDEEIEIEKEISRLYAKLESIRRERAEKNVKCVENKKESGVKKIPNKIQTRGLSLGPNEIMSAAAKSKQSVESTQNRRKSCFWKLDDIEEEKCGFSRRKISNLRQAVTTVGLKKGVKIDDSILGSIQPKKLFGDQSVPAKRPVKPGGRVIPSRYNQATVNSSMKKRSSLTTDTVERKPREGRVKKKWDIPSAIVIPNRFSLDGNEDESSVDVVIQPEVLLPRIRVVRYMEEAGRDSGPAKRVADLVGKKSYFDEEEAVCQQLSFDEQD